MQSSTANYYHKEKLAVGCLLRSLFTWKCSRNTLPSRLDVRWFRIAVLQGLTRTQRPDAEMGPTKIFIAIWASDISKIDSAV